MKANEVKKPVKFKLKRETIMELGVDELASIAGGQDATTTVGGGGGGNMQTASCCITCNTCAATTTGAGTCGGQC